MNGSLCAVRPEIGSIWSGGGSTFIVYEVWDEDARVYFLTGRTGLLKTPRSRAFTPLKSFADGRFRPLDVERDGVWTRAIVDRYGYNPPTEVDDPRICGRCRRAWGSVLGPADPSHFSVFNWLTNKYHAALHGGETHCGRDATGGEWLWPI